MESGHSVQGSFGREFSPMFDVNTFGCFVQWPRAICRDMNVLIGVIITRREAVASPSIGFTLWCVLTAFTRSAITPSEVNRFE